jgi:hypothetical protein
VFLGTLVAMGLEILPSSLLGSLAGLWIKLTDDRTVGEKQVYISKPRSLENVTRGRGQTFETYAVILATERTRGLEVLGKMVIKVTFPCQKKSLG